MLKKIIIICIGNICRSPMAEALLRERLKEIDPLISVSSAGLAALVNERADCLAQELMLERGLNISNHRARQATQQILFNSDLILTMEAGHQEQIHTMLPAIRGRVHTLGKWSDFDIPDPYQKPKGAFEQALVLIEQGIAEWQEKLWNNHAKKDQYTLY